MREEINRILKLVEQGELTGDQAAQMIEAITGAAGARTDSRRRPVSDGHRHRGRGGHGGGRRRQRGRNPFEDLANIGAGIDEAVNMGTETIRRAFEGAWGGTGSGSTWQNDGNTIMFGKAEEPEGEGFRVAGNQVIVSQIRDLGLGGSEFCDNQLNAAGVRDARFRDSVFNDNGVRGSSLRNIRAEGAEIRGNQLNGVQVARFTAANATFRKNTLNGSQLKDVGLADARIRGCQFNAVKWRSVMLKGGTNIKGSEFSGVAGRNWVLEATRFENVRIKGAVAPGLIANRVRLTDCSFAMDDWSGSIEASMRTGRMQADEVGSLRDLTLEDVELKGCRFDDCRFDRTAIRGVTAEGLEFRKVDFSGLTITSAEQLADLARTRAA